MYKSVERVVAEYVFAVGTFQFRIKARIAEKLGSGLNMQQPFSWSVSHYYKLNKDEPGPTVPTKTECASKDEAERLLYTYMRSFTDIAVPNNFY
jgi:hypothetical protein